ncbi:MAG: response regulator [Polyangiaceae bacterium]|nr:response regulator [Polyangiaceae bacterium]
MTKPAVDAPSSNGPVVPSVLLVDDKPANLLALEAILEPLGLRTVRANSGEEALKQLLKHDFALVLLDVQMPQMDGFETASAMKAHPRTAGIPIIFITAISREAAHVFKGYARGAVDYILKPFDPDILRAKVSIFVDLHTKGETIKAQAKLLHQRELEALERRSELRFRRLTDLMPLLMLAKRADGTVYYGNRAWADFTGSAEPRSLMDPDRLHPEEVNEVMQQWRESLGKESFFERQLRLRRVDGVFRWHLVRAVPERNEHGVCEGWIVTATDIDDQKHAEAERQRLFEAEQAARMAAEAATRMKDEFLATVSHELRTPLHSILGWAQMLRSGMLDGPRVQRALETIERNAGAQRELIDDLLDVSRIVRGNMRLQRRKMDVVAVAQTALDTVRPSADTKGVELAMKAASPTQEIWGDPDRIQQIVSNLLTNAVKFTPRGGHITVAISSTDADVSIVVRDTGAGIAEDFLPYVFERFRQADHTTTRAFQGLGLGLAIVRHLVELHEGKIAASSPGLGQGATFEVRLPIRLQNVDEPEAPWLRGQMRKTGPLDSDPGEDDPRELEGKTVLFVDDQRDALELFREIFEKQGARVVAVDSVDAALNALRSGTFDVLVSDIGMQGEDGYSLIRQVRELEKDSTDKTPAIAVSGFSRTDEGRRALAEGFQVFLTKPVDPDELLSIVASMGQAREHEGRPPGA